jgi:hydroxymethylbilane synthase
LEIGRAGHDRQDGTMSAPTLRIGTRGSRLARAQTDLVCRALASAHPQLAAPGALEAVVIRTTGDRVIDRSLAELGGKGLFCKELEAALLERRIELAVHSIKDLPTWLPAGLVLGAVLERADPRDVLLARTPATIAALPEAALIGTASVRRKAQLLAQRGDLRVVTFRGNVDTRLRKLAAGEVDATLLALAGLRRLGIEHAGVVLGPEEMLPAVGQGAIGVECRAEDEASLDLLAAIDHAASGACVRAERALLAALDGSCHTPIAGYAEIADHMLQLRALIARPDGSVCLRTARTGASGDAEALGRDAGAELKARAGAGFFH